jgi:Mlc titration factor MtfA (ptsG expression regulator)
VNWNLKSWYQGRIFKNEPIPDNVWLGALERLQFLHSLNTSEIAKLRQLVTLFLHAKQINGVRGLDVTKEMQVMVAAQACILILNLGLEYYDGWTEIIVYPGGFIRDFEYMDEYGIAHHVKEAAAGESWLGGPVILSWEDAADAENGRGYNVVIHEFAHKLDMLNGDANGYPPLHAGMSRQEWADVFVAAYAQFCGSVDAGDEAMVDPYAAESPAEFFAVMSEAFFQIPILVKQHFPLVYEQLALFYRQDTAQRCGRQ